MEGETGLTYCHDPLASGASSIQYDSSCTDVRADSFLSMLVWLFLSNRTVLKRRGKLFKGYLGFRK